MTRLSIAVAFSLFLAACAGRVGTGHKAFSTPQLGSVLYCLQSKAPSFGYAVPRYNAKSFLVRYVYGSRSPEDEADELHMVVYGPLERSATLFEVYLQAVHSKQQIFIGDAARLKKEKGRLVVEDIPGGQATLRRIEDLLVSVAHQQAVVIPPSQVRPGPAACVFEP